MPGPRKVCPQQMEVLLNFVEQNKEVGFGRHPGGPAGVLRVRAAWRNVAAELNDIEDGCNKSPEQWRRYWIEFKAKTRSKAADSRRSSASNEKMNRLIPLTEHEERVLMMAGMNTADDTNTEVKLEDHEKTVLLMTGNVLKDDDNVEVKLESDEDFEEEMSAPRASPYPDPLRIRRHRRNHYRPVRLSRAPAWVMRLEERRVAADERLAAAVETLAETVASRLDTLCALLATTNHHR